MSPSVANSSDPELQKKYEGQYSDTDASRVLKVDHEGLPLNPQPSSNPADPLNWPLKYKIFVLVQIAFVAGLGTLNTAIINPALSELAKEFHISTVRASYQTTVCIGLNGVAPWLAIPFANVYGRRPVYLVSMVVGTVSILGSGFTHSYGALLGVRAINGLFPVAFAVGIGSVNDMFFINQRGRALGLFTVLFANGGHLAPIPGGLIGEFLGWRWIFYFCAILDAAMLLVIVFCLPETLFDRDGALAEEKAGQVQYHPQGLSAHWRRLGRYGLGRCQAMPGRKVKLSQFFWPSIRMMRYPSVSLPALYYATAYGFGSMLPAVTVSAIFSETYHWSVLQIGAGYGTALFVGAFLGETLGGHVVDSLMNRARRTHGADAPPEVRLVALWPGEILVPGGLLVYGFCIQYKTHWIGPLIGMGAACAGVQCITTVCYSYMSDCHRKHSAEAGQLFNIFRQGVGCSLAFWVIRLGVKMEGYQYLFVLLAGITGVLAFIPMLYLMRHGEALRARYDTEDDM